MKKIISILTIGIFSLNFAQEAPKGNCCSGKDKKECSTADKKANQEYHKGCDKKIRPEVINKVTKKKNLFFIL